MDPAASSEPAGANWPVGLGRLRPRNFARLAEFIEGYAGIKMPPSKSTMLEGRLHKRVRATGMTSLDDYCRYLFEDDGLRTEVAFLIDAVSTNKTDFYREAGHFRVLRDAVLPDLVGQRQRAGTPRLNLWSAACSTGAEPYTLAIELAEFARTTAPLQAGILGTDINTEVLAAARRGVYSEDHVAPVPAALRQRYLLRSRDGARRLVRIAPELRAMARFGRLNLMADRFEVDAAFDIIFCRNVLIYFHREIQQGVLRRLCSHLRPDGYLFLGHSESITGLALPLAALGQNVFRRT
jgi:chemotaxis protein methyltransferase CheR